MDEDSDRFFEEMIENIDKKCPQNYDEETDESNITDESEDTECWNEEFVSNLYCQYKTPSKYL